MKTQIILILTLFFWGFAPKSKEKTIKIIDCRKGGCFTSNVEGHKVLDIELYRVISIDSTKGIEMYSLATYRMRENKLEHIQGCSVGTDEIYDKVSYKWLNDSTLKFKLFNSTNQQFEKHIFMMRGNSLAISTDN
jgi:hypothetical protein